MRANYNHIKMKKLVYLLAAGSMAFVACQNSPSYKVTGSVEDITDGDTIYLQEYAGGYSKTRFRYCQKRNFRIHRKTRYGCKPLHHLYERKQALLY